MMMLQPLRTSSSARSHNASIAQPMPSAPCSAGKVMSKVCDLKWAPLISEIERIFSRSSFVRIG